MASLFHIPASRLILLLGLGSSALLAGAWWFELWVGLIPCKLCLEQRQPHYGAAGVAVAAMPLLSMMRQMSARICRWLGVGALLVLAGLYLWSTWLGVYHSGVEWGWFMGPNDCGGAATAPAASMQDFMKQLQGMRVVSCTEAAWRLAGLSLAGWNALFSATFAALASVGVVTALRKASR